MTAKSPTEAVRNFQGDMQRALSCVTRNVVLASRSDVPSSLVHDLALSGGPVPLPGSGRIAINVKCRFTAMAEAGADTRWRARIITYLYSLREIDGPELLGYHWHPEGMSHETDPHLHLGAALRPGRTDILKAHLPTGEVQLPDILRFAIRDLGVRTLRTDWRTVLEETRASLAAPSP